MKAAGALLVLLLCLSEAQAQGERGAVDERDNHVEPGTVFQPDLWEELKFVRDMVHRLEDTVVAQGNTLISQGQMLKTMEAKLTASEAEVQEQRDLVTDLRQELVISKQEMEGMAR